MPHNRLGVKISDQVTQFNAHLTMKPESELTSYTLYNAHPTTAYAHDKAIVFLYLMHTHMTLALTCDWQSQHEH